MLNCALVVLGNYAKLPIPCISAELSLYELHRKPHEMVTDSTVVAVSPRALRSELMCPICLDLMKNPLTTKEVGLEKHASLATSESCMFLRDVATV